MAIVLGAWEPVDGWLVSRTLHSAGGRLVLQRQRRVFGGETPAEERSTVEKVHRAQASRFAASRARRHGCAVDESSQAMSMQLMSMSAADATVIDLPVGQSHGRDS